MGRLKQQGGSKTQDRRNCRSGRTLQRGRATEKRKESKRHKNKEGSREKTKDTACGKDCLKYKKPKGSYELQKQIEKRYALDRR